MSEIKTQIINLLSQLEDDSKDEEQLSLLLDDIADLLSTDEDETMTLISELDETQLSWIAPLFEELVFTFSSQKLVDLFEQKGQQYSDIPNISEYVLQAKEAMND